MWTQRAGRAGRSPSIEAKAILLAQKSVLQQIKATSKPPAKVKASVAKLRLPKSKSKGTRKATQKQKRLLAMKVPLVQRRPKKPVKPKKSKRARVEVAGDNSPLSLRSTGTVDEPSDDRDGPVDDTVLDRLAEDENSDSSRVFRKNVEPSLREYISTSNCRRETADLYFDNPPGRSEQFLC